MNLRTLFKKDRATARGGTAELAAQKHLEDRGYSTLAANQSTRFGEVDLVMEKGDVVVFVEVRQRASPAFGSAAETVTFKKQSRIAKAALAFVKLHGLARRPMRFDVVSIDGEKLSHIENAFVPGGYHL